MIKSITATAALLFSINTFAADDIVTPLDMPQKAQDKMYTMITDYNKCMMQGALKTDQQGGDPRAKADTILKSCEPKLDVLKTHLTKNHVTPGLVDGFIVKMRSRAARLLLTHTITNMAMQAAAAENAGKSNKQQTQAPATSNQ